MKKYILFLVAIVAMAFVVTSCYTRRVYNTAIQEQYEPVRGEWHDCAICGGKGGCVKCNGTGKINGGTCATCKGTGRCQTCNGNGGYTK